MWLIKKKNLISQHKGTFYECFEKKKKEKKKFGIIIDAIPTDFNHIADHFQRNTYLSIFYLFIYF